MGSEPGRATTLSSERSSRREDLDVDEELEQARREAVVADARRVGTQATSAASSPASDEVGIAQRVTAKSRITKWCPSASSPIRSTQPRKR